MRLPRSEILVGDALSRLRELPDASVHCCVTSPPYWALRQYGIDGQLGLEDSPAAYVEAIGRVFSEVRRVLRPDGTLWLNLGDSYVTAPHGRGSTHDPLWPGGRDRSMDVANRQSNRHDKAPCVATAHRRVHGLPHKSLVGIPWLVAFALQRDGWVLRSDIVWSKVAPMPESIADRPTRAHEYVFLLSPSSRYFYDAQAIAEPTSGGAHPRGRGLNPKAREPAKNERTGQARRDGLSERWRVKQNASFSTAVADLVETRNRRDVWTIRPEPFSSPDGEADHFAVMPTALVEPCILAGTSARGVCSSCGAPVTRVVKRQRMVDGAPTELGAMRAHDPAAPSSATGVGHGRIASVATGESWLDGCDCEAEKVPAVVLDPFCGAGTVGLVAHRHGRDFVGIELNPAYAKLARARIHDDAPLLQVAR